MAELNGYGVKTSTRCDCLPPTYRPKRHARNWPPVDTRKWLLSKILPRVYGDKLTVGGDPKTPIHHVVAIGELAALSDVELDALERFTDARLAAQDVENRGD